MVDEYLTFKYFAILDSEDKAKSFDFNDGYNYLILHTFDDYVYHKLRADKETIESHQLIYSHGEGNGKYIENDEDYQHENIV